MASRGSNGMRRVRKHWFVPIALITLFVNASTVYLDQWASPKLLEVGLLFDFAILLPVLYLVCYRTDGKRAVIRALGLACLGIWAIGHVVPESSHSLLKDLEPLRYCGLGVLVLLQVKLVVAVFRAAANDSQRANREAERLAAETGTPPWVRELLAWEAAVWVRIWKRLRRIFLRE